MDQGSASQRRPNFLLHIGLIVIKVGCVSVRNYINVLSGKCVWCMNVYVVGRQRVYWREENYIPYQSVLALIMTCVLFPMHVSSEMYVCV